MLEDRETEPKNLFRAPISGLRTHGGDGTKYVVESCGEEIVLISEVHIKRRPADVGAIKDLLDSDRVVVSFMNQRMEGIA